MSSAGGPDAHLIGRPGSRARLSTPALLLDLDALERNIAAMAAHCRDLGIALRPHAKTHKSVAISRLQVEAGALGICCATLAEAEVIAGAGVAGVLVTSPVVTAAKIERLMALNGRARGLMAVADDAGNLARLAKAAGGAGKTLKVLVDLDIGLARTGAAGVDDAVALARQAAEAPALEFMGLQAYAGHLQQIADLEERRQASARALAPLAELKERLTALGLEPRVVSGGGTGTHDIDPAAGLFSELQAGSYAVMDVQYNAVALKPAANPFETALFVQTAVISANHPGFVTTDAGLKRFATDGPAPTIASGAPKGARYGFAGDEHGRVTFAAPGERLALGDLIECVTPHCDPTINLYDRYHCLRGDTLVDIWPVDARGAD
jgi:D-serine deaminase-like pyridoxal phosphate-dependent protein